MDIIFLVAIMAISIISSAAKSKKKKKQTPPPPSAATDDADDPWASIRKYFEITEKEDEAEDEEPAPRNLAQETTFHKSIPAQIESEYKPLESVSVENPKGSSVAQKNTASGREETFKAKINPAAGKKYINKSEELQINLAEYDDIGIDDFDLRTAVLYSEILKPKFED